MGAEARPSVILTEGKSLSKQLHRSAAWESPRESLP
jgi:hypothetical protein